MDSDSLLPGWPNRSLEEQVVHVVNANSLSVINVFRVSCKLVCLHFRSQCHFVERVVLQNDLFETLAGCTVEQKRNF